MSGRGKNCTYGKTRRGKNCTYGKFQWYLMRTNESNNLCGIPGTGRFKAVGFDMDGTFMKTRVDYSRLNNADRTVLERHDVPFDSIDFGGRAKRLRAPIRDWLLANGRADEWPEIYREIEQLTLECECEFV